MFHFTGYFLGFVGKFGVSYVFYNTNIVLKSPIMRVVIIYNHHITGIAVRCEPRKKRAAAKNYFFSAEVSQNMRSTGRGGS